MLGRVEALATVHRRLYQGDAVGRFDVAEFARDLTTNMIAASGREDIALDLNLEPVELAASKAAPLSLMVNELIANAIKHAFKERGGRIALAVKRRGGDLLIRLEDDGVGLPEQELGGQSFGMMVVKSLARQLQAQVSRAAGEAGTRIEIVLPIEAAEGSGPA